MDFLLRLPIAHIEGVGNDPRTRLQLLEQLGAQLQIDIGQQKQGHHGGLVKVGLEQVVFLEANQVLHAGLLGVLPGLADAHRVDIDPHAASPVSLGGRDDNPAIAAAEVINHVGLFDVGKFQHGLHGLFGSGHEGHVRRPPRLRSLGRNCSGKHRGSHQRVNARFLEHRSPPVSEIIATRGRMHPGGVRKTTSPERLRRSIARRGAGSPTWAAPR